MIARGIALALMLPVAALAGEKITVVGFNVEAGFKPDADPDTIAQQISSYGAVDFWGFSEVSADGWRGKLEGGAKAAAGGNSSFSSILGTTSQDRLLIVYNSDRWVIDSDCGAGECELKELQFGGGGRAPLYAEFHLKAKPATKLIFMVNHLHRAAAAKRKQQAVGLWSWAQDQDVPVIAVGDYNFDWDVETGGTDPDAGFDAMTRDSVFRWVRPKIIKASQCNPEYNSILDFVFVSELAQAPGWKRRSEILERSDAYCVDTNKTSDHRPVRAVIEMP